MFQSVRPNSPIFILHKSDTPSIETGSVTNQPIPRPKYQLPTSFGQPQETIVDLVVRIGDKTVNFSGLPAQSDVADSTSNGESLVISDSKEAMNSEILNLKQRSTDVINSVDIHKKLIEEYERILAQLNPEFAEKQEQKQELDTLKAQMAEMSRSISALMETNKQLIEKLQH